MAFRQPTFHAPQRHVAPEALHQQISSLQQSEQLDESQEWILFPAGTPSATDRTSTAFTHRTRRTAGRSQISHYGSLDTAARSYGYEEDGSGHTGGVLEDEEDGELDSLDSHLHEFRAEPGTFREPFGEDLNASSNPVLPTHDGLGSFRIDQTAMGDGVQEHLYAFERYNPRRIKRRRESLELGQMTLENERLVEHERIRRIEEWRLEQSRALLEEIHKEARRREQSMSSERRSVLLDTQEEEDATLGSVTGIESQPSESQPLLPDAENDGFWSRITRRVIQDLMGIDDNLLSILFGECLPEDDDLSSTPPASNPLRSVIAKANINNNSWESRLLYRIARELGILVNQLSDHPGAFSTYLKVQQMPLPYAGLPIIPEVVQDVPHKADPSTMAASAPDFKPTIEKATQPRDIYNKISRSAQFDTMLVDDIDATPRPGFPIHEALETQDSHFDFTKEEWEKQLDIKMVFRYLRSRFTSRPANHSPFLREASSLATSSPQEAAARAARVRQHHPLVTRQKPVERRTFKAVVPTSPILHRRASSCASQSTRKSARRNSGSSRHYWDINGSIGSGSLIASAGGWGEV